MEFGKAKYDWPKYLAVFEVLAGAILLAFEIRDYITLPTAAEFDILHPDLNLLQYKEGTYPLLFIWSVLLFAGLSYWVNKRLHWICNQVLLVSLFGSTVTLLLLVLILSLNPSLITVFAVIAIIIILSAVFIRLEMGLFSKKCQHKNNIDHRTIWITAVLFILFCAICVFLDNINHFLSEPWIS